MFVIWESIATLKIPKLRRYTFEEQKDVSVYLEVYSVDQFKSFNWETSIERIPVIGILFN